MLVAELQMNSGHRLSLEPIQPRIATEIQENPVISLQHQNYSFQSQHMNYLVVCNPRTG